MRNIRQLMKTKKPLLIVALWTTIKLFFPIAAGSDMFLIENIVLSILIINLILIFFFKANRLFFYVVLMLAYLILLLPTYDDCIGDLSVRFGVLIHQFDIHKFWVVKLIDIIIIGALLVLELVLIIKVISKKSDRP